MSIIFTKLIRNVCKLRCKGIKIAIRREVIKIYNYIYVTAKTSGFFRTADHRELIDKYSQEGWRFITAIPSEFDGSGKTTEFDLVFEKEN